MFSTVLGYKHWVHSKKSGWTHSHVRLSGAELVSGTRGQSLACRPPILVLGQTTVAPCGSS